MGSPFNGRWAINMEDSREWDVDKQEWVPDHAGREVAEIKIDGDKYHFALEIGLNPIVHLEYDAVLDSDWVPYMCSKIEHPDNAEVPAFDPATQGLQHVDFEIGKPISYCRLININENMHVRVSRHPENSELLYVMTEEVGKDGRLRAYVTSPDGVAMIYRVADKIG